jgi:hypothetical protein
MFVFLLLKDVRPLIALLRYYVANVNLELRNIVPSPVNFLIWGAHTLTSETVHWLQGVLYQEYVRLVI